MKNQRLNSFWFRKQCLTPKFSKIFTLSQKIRLKALPSLEKKSLADTYFIDTPMLGLYFYMFLLVQIDCLVCLTTLAKEMIETPTSTTEMIVWSSINIMTTVSTSATDMRKISNSANEPIKWEWQRVQPMQRYQH